MQRLHSTLCGALTTLLLAPLLASAQTDPPIETRSYPGARTVGSETESKVRPGIEAGGFIIRPSLLFSSYHDDNLYATNDSEVEDYVFVVSPTLRAYSNWSEHALNVELGADAARYAERGTEDHEHYRAIVEGRYDISPTFNAFAGIRYYRDTEDRESPDDVFGRSPTVYEDLGAYVGTFKQVGRFGLRLGGTWQQLNFEDAVSQLLAGPVLGSINNDDRDRDLFTAGAHLSYLFAPGKVGFVQLAGDFRRYRDAADDFGFDRDSDGVRMIGGFNLSTGGVIEAEFYGGFLEQTFDDDNFETVREPTFGMVVDWFVSELTTLSAYADRTLAETTAFGASSFLNAIVGLQANHEFTRRLSGGMRMGYTRSEFREIDRDEDYLFVGFTGRFLFGEYFFCQVDYQFRNLDSSIPDFDFARNHIYFRLGASY